MGHVGRVVDAQPDGDDDVGAADSVNCQTPKVDKATNIDKGEHDTAKDEKAGPQVEEEDPGGDEDTEDGEADVPVQLLRDYLICLPGGIALVRLEVSVGVADQTAVPAGFDPPLVNAEPGNEPGGLQKVDNNQTYCTEEAE